MYNRYALLLDSLYPNNVSQAIVQEIFNKPQYDVTIFLLNRENVIPSPLAVFSIADYFNFKGIPIATSNATMDKINNYPGQEIVVAIATDIPNVINVPQLDLDLIEKAVNDYRTQHQTDVSGRN